MTILYDGWRFKEPELLTRGEFLTYKQLLFLYPDKSLNPDTDKLFWQSSKISIILIGLGLVGLVICSFADAGNFGKGAISTIMETIGAILFVVGFFTFIPFVLTGASYIRFCEQKSEWYKKLEDVINASDDYAEFLSNYKESFISSHQLGNYDRE